MGNICGLVAKRWRSQSTNRPSGPIYRLFGPDSHGWFPCGFLQYKVSQKRKKKKKEASKDYIEGDPRGADSKVLELILQ
jgi:hypothetical protein